MELGELQIGDGDAGADRHRHARRRWRRPGLEVMAQSCPAPPAATTTDLGVEVRSAPSGRASSATNPVHRPSSTSRSSAKAPAKTSTPGRARTPATSARSISAPVASPPAWRTRRRLWAASRPSSSLARSDVVAVEARAERQQPLDRRRRALDQFADRVRVAEAGAGDQGVRLVQRRRIVGADRRRQTALRPAGVALAEHPLGQEGDPQRCRAGAG